MLNGKKVIALIQARCTSTRLPKKHLRHIGNKMLIDWVVDRLKNMNELDEIIVSTTNDTSDIPLKEYSKKKGIGFYGYNGDINDVVGRHYNAVKNTNADYVVVISGDCPLIDEKLIMKQLHSLQQGFDYIRPNQRCVHEGIDSYSMKCMKFLNENSNTLYERENFGVILRENLNLVKVGFIDIEEKYTNNIFRISVDNMADLKFMNKLYELLNNKCKLFNLENVLELVKQDKHLLDDNKHVHQKKKEEKTYKFLIKTEASREKGLGHIKRMMALGQYLNENKNNGVLYAINKNEIAKNILKEKGYIYDYSYAEEEKELIELINKYKPDFLIIDVQQLSGSIKYNFENIKEHTSVKKIVLIDKYIEDKSVDLMIVQGLQSDEFEEKVKDNNKVIYGLECVFIDDNFVKAKKQREKIRTFNKQQKEIVISFGGSDIKDLTLYTINSLKNVIIDFNVKFKIILGPYYKNFSQLTQALSDFKYKYEIIKNPVNYAQELINADYGIIAYGVSFYEFLYMGIPAVITNIHDNDISIVKKCINEGLVIEFKELIYNNKSINQLEKVNLGDLYYIYKKIINEN